MSWLTATILILLAGFVCAFILVEWIVARPRRSGDDDSSAMG